ncbi:transposase [Paenibacillus soyae]|uniref:Transposase n=1 Tax=Paenibacillus soyae TaxID=2969249 RepID=A0A9X2MPJ8_9BACL|nr:transposase [Paenibacillus soyae]MCR2803849.1 transposase [Paenibacillus soyae]
MMHSLIAQFESRFPDEQACADAVQLWKWPNGFCCAACGHRESYKIDTRRLPLFECRICKRQASLTSNTLMHKSSTSLKQWLLAVFLVSSYDRGLNAVMLSQVLQVTYKTAWRMLHLIRVAISRMDEDQILQGKVEAKLEVWMRHLFPTDDNLQTEKPVIIAKGRGGQGEIYYKMKLIDRKQQARMPLLEVEKTAFVDRYCDGLNSNVQFNGRSQQLRKQSMHTYKLYATDREDGSSLDFQSIIHSRKYPLSIVASEAFQWLNDRFHGLGRKYVQFYLDEYCFRLNVSNREPVQATELLLSRMLMPFQVKQQRALNPQRAA